MTSVFVAVILCVAIFFYLRRRPKTEPPEWEKVCTLASTYALHRIQSELTTAGIQNKLKPESTRAYGEPSLIHVQPGTIPMSILVRPRDLDRAWKIIDRLKAEDLQE